MGSLFIHGDPIIKEREEKVMKKRAISFVLCLMMVVTLLGNGIPVYAANELEPPIISTEETSQETPEESEAEGSPAVEASEAAHGEDTNAAGETSSEVAGISETDETTEATDAEETAWAEEETEAKTSEATDTEESATVNSPETTEEAVAEEKPDVATPAEVDNGLVTVPNEDGLTLQEIINAAEDNTLTTIEITEDIELESCLLIPANKDIKIQSSDEEQYTIEAPGGLIALFQNLISVEEGAHLTFENVRILSSRQGTRGPVLLVNGEVTLGEDAIITTNSNEKQFASAVKVDGEDAILTIAGGTISDFSFTGSGGAVFVENGTLNITSGTIENCSAHLGGAVAVEKQGTVIMSGGQIKECKADESGGGIYLAPTGSTFDMSGGEITSCDAWWAGGAIADDGGNSVSISGGHISKNNSINGAGVYVGNLSTFHMSDGAIVSNHSNASGGGLHLMGATGEMTGGTISYNTADSQGGGIVLFQDKADGNLTITAGTISHNTANGIDLGGVMHYAGGGIYVDEGCALHLYNVAIANNEAVNNPTRQGRGGGFAACPTAKVEIHLNQGAIIYQNRDQSGFADEVYVQERGANQNIPFISQYYLGGGKYDWTDAKGNTIDVYQSVQTYRDDPNQNITLFNDLTDKDPGVKDALEEVKVHIAENKGLYGGGIATNGTVIIGTETEEPATGDLTVSKAVSGDGADSNKPFSFTISATYKPFKAINGTYGDMKFIDGVANFTLKDKESKTASGLPAGTVYTVTENDNDDYTVTKANSEGTIQQDTTVTASFENRKEMPPCPCGEGELTVAKTVTGSGGDLNKEFTFTVTLDKKNLSGQYGDMTFANGVATFTLKHGQSKTAKRLPAGASYTVEETGSDGYIVSKTNAAGTIQTGSTATVAFENYKERPGNGTDAPPNPPVDPPTEKTGNLAVTKTVSGSRGDQNKEFTFTVTLDKKDLNGKYGDMNFTDGVATFTLKHGQSKTANGLPAGVSYTVEESDNSGYTVTKTNATGTVQTGSTATAAFENYKGSSGGSGGSGGGGGGSSSHTPQAARVTLTATKTMDGLIPTGSGFTFFLDDANGQRLQVKNNQGGNITFDTLTFDKTGTYVYYLTEQTGNDKNVNYDTSSYKVTVTVTCPYDYAASVSYEKNGQAYNSVPAFANTTKPSASAPTPTQTPPVVAPARPLDNVPKTEDSSNLALWGILAAASLLSLTVLLAGTKTRKVRSQSKEHQS